MTAASSSGSTGFATYASKPADRILIRSVTPP